MEETPGIYEKGMVAMLSSDLMQACKISHVRPTGALSRSANFVARMRCS